MCLQATVNWDQSGIPIGPIPAIPKSVRPQISPLINSCEVPTNAPASRRARIHSAHAEGVDRQGVALACELLVIGDLGIHHLGRLPEIEFQGNRLFIFLGKRRIKVA